MTGNHEKCRFTFRRRIRRWHGHYYLFQCPGCNRAWSPNIKDFWEGAK